MWSTKQGAEDVVWAAELRMCETESRQEAFCTLLIADVLSWFLGEAVDETPGHSHPAQCLGYADVSCGCSVGQMLSLGCSGNASAGS